MLIGTFCRFSERFWAVTMMTSPLSSTGVGAGDASAGWAGWAKTAPVEQRMVEPNRPNAARLRFMWSPPHWRLWPRESAAFGGASNLFGGETKSRANVTDLQRFAFIAGP